MTPQKKSGSVTWFLMNRIRLKQLIRIRPDLDPDIPKKVQLCTVMNFMYDIENLKISYTKYIAKKITYWQIMTFTTESLGYE